MSDFKTKGKTSPLQPRPTGFTLSVTTSSATVISWDPIPILRYEGKEELGELLPSQRTSAWPAQPPAEARGTTKGCRCPGTRAGPTLPRPAAPERPCRQHREQAPRRAVTAAVGAAGAGLRPAARSAPVLLRLQTSGLRYSMFRVWTTQCLY